MKKQRAVPLLLAALFFAVATFAGQDRPAGSEGVPRDVARLQQRTPVVEILIEFRQPPAATGVSRMSADALRARIEALRPSIEQLRRDLVRLDENARNARRAMSSDSEQESARVTQAYSRVLFGAAVRAHRDMLPAIRALPYVTNARIARTFKTMLADSVAQIRAKEVWTTRGARGKGIVVAVIDTGIDYTHPALGGGMGATFKVLGGYDFFNNDADPKDDHGHGTHVAGIIAANGGEQLTGVAPEASLLAYKVLSADGSGTESTIIAAVERTVDPDQNGDPSDHAHVANMSLGGPADDDDLLVKAVENASAAGVTFVIASGNAGEYGNLPSPAIAPSAITVGAVDGNDSVALFSNRGPTIAFTLKPEVVAPGVGISSTFLGGRTESLSGTSMATPHVAGVVALIKTLHPEWSSAEIKSAIVGTAAPLDTDLMDQGGGRIDAMLATAPAILSSPVTIDFGQVGPAEVFTSRRQVTLRNVTAQSQTLTAAVGGNRDGIAVQVTPAVVTLAPGESQVVTLDLSFSNKRVPAPQSGSLSFGGFVTWSGGTTSFHMPWTTVKAAFLTIDVSNNLTAVYAEIMGDHKKVISGDFDLRMRTLWRLEPVDIMVFEDRRRAGDYPVHIAFAESVNIDAAGANVKIDMDEAKYTFDTADTLGPDGRPLLGTRRCIDEAVMAFPGGKKTGFGQLSVVDEVPGFGHNFHVLWSKLSTRVKIYVTTVCSDIEAKSLYIAQHDRFEGLQSNVQTKMTRPWVTPQAIRFVPEAANSMGLTIGYARVMFPSNGDEEEFYTGAAEGHLMRPMGPELKMYFTTPPDNAVSLLANVERFRPCASGPECTFIDNVWIYPNAQGSFVDSDLYLDMSPMAYRARPDRELIVGDTPVFPSAGFGGGLNLWVAGVNWKGALGEGRAQDSIRSHVVVYDASGAVIGEATGSVVKNETLRPGRYRLEATSPDVLVSGRTARGTVHVSVDTTKADAITPKFTGVRVEDEYHVQTTSVKRHSRAALLFSATDEYVDAPYIRRRPAREEATRVEYRQHGTTDWHPLPPLAIARQYRNNSFLFAGVGTMYRVDLAAVTSAITGEVDLRLHIEDETGNSVDYTLEPAFVVEGDAPQSVPRRRSIRH